MTVLFPTPVVYDGDDTRFLRRDGARFIPSLTAAGGVGIKVIFPAENPSLTPKSPALALGCETEWRDPFFWRTFHADAAICYFGLSSRRFLPVVRAIRKAGLRLVLKTDSSFGLNEFPSLAWTWARKCYWVARERHRVMSALAKSAFDFAKWVRGFDPKTMIPYVDAFDLVAVESPLSLENTRNWLSRHGRADLAGKLAFIPHPVPDNFIFDPMQHCKGNVVLAVAEDWRNPRKGGKILAKALSMFLSARPDWHATVVGAHSDALVSLIGRSSQTAAVARTMPETLLPLYRSAKVFVTASGSESGPIVAFEALACGCSVVFPPELLQLRWMADCGRGVMAESRSPSALAAAMSRVVSAFQGVSAKGTTPPLHASEIMDEIFRFLDTRTPGSRTAVAATNHDCSG